MWQLYWFSGGKPYLCIRTRFAGMQRGCQPAKFHAFTVTRHVNSGGHEKCFCNYCYFNSFSCRNICFPVRIPPRRIRIAPAAVYATLVQVCFETGKDSCMRSNFYQCRKTGRQALFDEQDEIIWPSIGLFLSLIFWTAIILLICCMCVRNLHAARFL